MIERVERNRRENSPLEKGVGEAWDEIANRFGPGVHWLEGWQSPAGKQGFLIVLNRTAHPFYHVKNRGQRERAEEDANSYLGFKTHPEVLYDVDKLNGDYYPRIINWLQGRLEGYANP